MTGSYESGMVVCGPHRAGTSNSLVELFSVFGSGRITATASTKRDVISNCTIISWEQFLSMTRFDDDTEWHETMRLYREGSEPTYRREMRDTKKRSKSDATSVRNSNGNKNVARKNSASYRHSLPGIIENTSNTQGYVPQVDNSHDTLSIRSSSSLIREAKTLHDALLGSNLDKKSVSMSDLRTLPSSSSPNSSRINSKLPARSQDNISQTSSSSSRSSSKDSGISSKVSNVKKILRIMHTE